MPAILIFPTVMLINPFDIYIYTLYLSKKKFQFLIEGNFDLTNNNLHLTNNNLHLIESNLHLIESNFDLLFVKIII